MSLTTFMERILKRLITSRLCTKICLSLILTSDIILPFDPNLLFLFISSLTNKHFPRPDKRKVQKQSYISFSSSYSIVHMLLH